jgi:AcrR family transcriptional regulator
MPTRTRAGGAGPGRTTSHQQPNVPTLDRRGILQVALRLVDADGLGALTMRRLGAELGVEAMSLYYYIPSKAELTRGLAEIVLGELRLPPQGLSADDWPAALREVARSFRNLGFAHPNVFPLLAQIGLDNPAAYPPTEAVLALLRSAGFDEQLAFTAFSTIKSYVVGHVLWILGDTLVGKGQLIQRDEPRFAERFPQLAAYLPYISDCDEEVEFERALDVLIAGLQVLRANSPR